MEQVRERARAKLNLTLDVLGRREDGYHDLRMVMQSVEYGDDVTLLPGESGGGPRVESENRFLPGGEKNLAVAAALRYWEALGLSPQDLTIRLEKRIPMCAGMAGGSSDAAAVLRALNRLRGEPFSPQTLAQVGERVGSDVPYCVLGCTALVEGRGERITPLTPLPGCWIVICKPDFPVSTPELFAAIDRVRLRRRPDTRGLLRSLEEGDLEGLARRMYNVFEDVLPRRQAAKVAEIKHTLIDQGALGATMSGSGPTAFGLFREEEEARRAFQLLKESYRDTFLTRPV